MNTPIVYKQGWNDERKLLLKLAEIMQNARYIQKRGKNKFHNYNYVTEADVNEKIGDMLAERKVVFIPNLVSSDMRETTTKSGNIEYIVKARMEFTFMDAETGESVTANMEGEGQDNGDKAIYKSISGTQKYILLKFFMLASGDDPEGDESVDQRNAVKDIPVNGSKQESADIGAKKLEEAKAKANNPTPTADKISDAQLKLFSNKAKNSGYVTPEQITLLKSELLEKFGVSEPADIPKAKFNQVLTWIQSQIAPVMGIVDDSDLPF